MNTDSRFRRALAAATRPMFTWLIFLTVYLGWHDATLYNAALRSSFVHDVQHITFFLAAMLFWWPVIGAAPQLHGRFPGLARMAYLIGMVPPNMFVGVTIAYATTVIYSYYESVPRIWGVSALEDQMIGGAIMWIPGSMMFILAALIVLARMFGEKDAPPVQPGDWDDESAMIMPGLEHRALQNKWRQIAAHGQTGCGRAMMRLKMRLKLPLGMRMLFVAAALAAVSRRRWRRRAMAAARLGSRVSRRVPTASMHGASRSRCAQAKRT